MKKSALGFCKHEKNEVIRKKGQGLKCNIHTKYTQSSISFHLSDVQFNAIQRDSQQADHMSDCLLCLLSLLAIAVSFALHSCILLYRITYITI